MSRRLPDPPPLRPFGLKLHRDGSFSHEGIAVTHPRLLRAFRRGVRYLPEEGRYVVQLGRFRGQIEVEEAGFFVRGVDLGRGTLDLSDGTSEGLDPGTLRLSRRDGALLCQVKRGLAPGGLPARFTRSAQATLGLGVEETREGPALRLAGRLVPLPPALLT